jgi:signal transduction histidine kinase
LRARLDHRLIFTSAVFLLLLCGSVLTWMMYRIYSGELWVHHTYDVQLAVAELESDLSRAGRDRQLYLRDNEQRTLQDISEARTEVLNDLVQLKSMVKDNVDEVKNCAALEQAVNARLHLIDESLRAAASGNSSIESQEPYTAQIIQSSKQTSELTQTIKEAESGLLERRLFITQSLFRWIIVILAITYLLALYMLWEHFRGITRELAERKRAEQAALDLSSQLLNAQDQERRKIARDLHDGLGQVLVAAKLIADSFQKRTPDPQRISELRDLLEDAVSSTRSMSHLLYPPLVDELGFISAARSYLEGFSKRTGIEFSFDLPDSPQRLPRDLELALFRILQEALTNIQRHSKSTKAGVQFNADSRQANIKIWDNGVGIPAEMLENPHANGSGVGLAGMRERVRERKGRLNINSDSRGTAISASFPISPTPS